MATVEITGWDKLHLAIKSITSNLPQLADDSTKETAEAIRDLAKEYVPVDTASLQKSIRIEVFKYFNAYDKGYRVRAGGYVVNPKTGRLVEYAAYVEFGTSRQRPQPFLSRAVLEHRETLVKILKTRFLEHARSRWR